MGVADTGETSGRFGSMLAGQPPRSSRGEFLTLFRGGRGRGRSRRRQGGLVGGQVLGRRRNVFGPGRQVRDVVEVVLQESKYLRALQCRVLGVDIQGTRQRGVRFIQDGRRAREDRRGI